MADSDPDTDPRFQPGAYISLTGDRLYFVRYWEATGSDSGKLHVINVHGEVHCWLGADAASNTKLERAAPKLEVDSLELRQAA